MKRDQTPIWIWVLLMIVLLFAGATTIEANEMILVEDYTADTVKVPSTPDTAVASVEFTLDRDAMISMATGGLIQYFTQYTGDWLIIPEAVSWITMNGGKLDYSMGSPHLNAGYFFALPAGHYKFQLRVNTTDPRILKWTADNNMAHILNPRIQALIILSDTTQGCVAEEPRNGDNNLLPKAIVASGPSIRVPGCNKIVDVTGRTVNTTISNDEVMIKDLPRGTYFITGNKQNIKVVKM